jgi:hypothetical protein
MDAQTWALQAGFRWGRSGAIVLDAHTSKAWGLTVESFACIVMTLVVGGLLLSMVITERKRIRCKECRNG